MTLRTPSASDEKTLYIPCAVVAIVFFFNELFAFLAHFLAPNYLPKFLFPLSSTTLNLFSILLCLWLILFGQYLKKSDAKALYFLSLSLVIFWILYWTTYPSLALFFQWRIERFYVGTFVFILPHGKFARIPFYLDMALSIWIIGRGPLYWLKVNLIDPLSSTIGKRSAEIKNSFKLLSFIGQRFGKFSSVLYVILLFSFIDFLLFGRGLYWEIKPILRGSGQPWSFQEGMSFDSVLRKLSYPRQTAEEASKTLDILFFGDSTSNQAFNTKKIQEQLESKIPDQAFGLHKSCWNGQRPSSIPFLIRQVIAKREFDVFVFGIYQSAYLQGPDRMSALYSKPLDFKSIDAAGRRSLAEELLRRNWDLFRLRGVCKDYIYRQSTAVFGWLVSEDISPKSGEDKTDLIPEKNNKTVFLNKYRETGESFYFHRFIASFRAPEYVRQHIRPEGLAARDDKMIDENLSFLRETLEICRKKKIKCVAVTIPMNPVLKDHGYDLLTREFIAHKMKPFFDTNGVAFYDFSDSMEAEYFGDYNHLKPKGGKIFSSTFGEMLAEDILNDSKS